MCSDIKKENEELKQELAIYSYNVEVLNKDNKKFKSEIRHLKAVIVQLKIKLEDK